MNIALFQDLHEVRLLLLVNNYYLGHNEMWDLY